MQGHERDLLSGFVLVGIADKGGVVEKLIQSFPPVTRIHGRIYQFANVLNAGESFGRFLFFQLANVTCAVNQELQDFRGAGRAAGGAESIVRRGFLLVSRALYGRRLTVDGKFTRSAGILPAVLGASRP